MRPNVPGQPPWPKAARRCTDSTPDIADAEPAQACTEPDYQSARNLGEMLADMQTEADEIEKRLEDDALAPKPGAISDADRSPSAATCRSSKRWRAWTATCPRPRFRTRRKKIHKLLGDG